VQTEKYAANIGKIRQTQREYDDEYYDEEEDP
jgi:hypothetical protein